MTVFLRVLEASVENKPAELLRLVAAARAPSAEQQTLERWIFTREPTAFGAVPGSPFAYWVRDGVRETFVRLAPFESNGRTAKGGMKTQADERFLRAFWEVSDRVSWVALCKGGQFSRFYSDVHLVTDWRDSGKRPRAAYEHRVQGESWGGFGRNEAYYFRPGLTWPLRTQRGFGMRAMPPGCVFGHKGPAAFVDGDSPEALLSLLAISTSAAFCYLIELQMAFGSYEVGVIQRTPVPSLSDDDIVALARVARMAWSRKRSLDTTNETSHGFVLPPGVNERVTGLNRDAVELELAVLEKQIDDVAFRIYGIGPKDRAAIEASFKRGVVSDGGTEVYDDQDNDGSEARAIADTLISWLVGVAFGRFDSRLATGERPLPPEPEPFDALPARSPGMYPEGEEPGRRADILVDDEGHSDDLAARVRAIAERAHVDVPEDLRVWLAREFFPLHVKMYSKSRRKAPIYWQLATTSGRYSVWLYIHAFSKDTLFRVQNDYAAPKLAHEERRLESMMSELRHGATAAQRKALATQESVVEELRAFLDEVKRVAPLWNPNLDDGVIINFAPLWRLVPENKSWQKEVKSTWKVLCEGTYDWAHLAMHLWPERVAPKCAKDRSLAIAHGLEDVFWVEGSDGKWKARNTPTQPIDELVRERTSPAVKAALKSLLEAPTATGNGRGGAGRRRRAEEGGSR